MPLSFGGTRFLLASQSPRRSQILSAAGFDFELVEPGVEPGPTNASAKEQCVESARQKALGARFDGKSGILLAVDTVVSIDERSLGKPRDRAEAGEFLDLLAGRHHEVLTAHAHARVDQGRCSQVDVIVSQATLACRRLEVAEREIYLDSGDWKDKAGGYGIQSLASAFMTLVRGDVDTVVGLSLRAVREILGAH